MPAPDPRKDSDDEGQAAGFSYAGLEQTGAKTAKLGDEFLALGRQRRFHPGDVVLSPAHEVSHAARITSGLVKVTAATAAGVQTLLSVRGSDDMLNEEAAFRRDPGPGRPGRDLRITATALTAVSARVFPAGQLRRVLDEHPAYLAAVVQKICGRLEEAESRIASMGHDSADRRLARLLCDLERYGRPARRGNGVIGTTIPVSLSHAELAAWIGTCRETVDRVFRRWRDRGFVSTYYRTIVVHDLEALARIAGIQVRRQAWNWPTTRNSTSRPALPAPGIRRGAA